MAIWNNNGDNSSYILTGVPTSLPSATIPPDSPYIKLVYKAGNASAVCSIGNNILYKVRYIEEGVMPELVTLQATQKLGLLEPWPFIYSINQYLT